MNEALAAPWLDADDELESQLVRTAGPDTFGVWLDAQLAADRERALLMAGRALMRAVAEYEQAEAWERAVLRDVEDRKNRARARVAALDAEIKRVVREERERDPRQKALAIPGVPGRWQSTATPGRWEIDERAVLAALSDDERVLFVEQVHSERLRGKEFREHLDATGEIPPGVERVPEGVRVNGPYDGIVGKP